MDAVARALADHTRRDILRLITDHEDTVTSIAAQFPVSRPAISQHLRVLHDADLVTVRREGTRRYYTAHPEGLVGLRDWLDGFWNESLDALKLEVEQEQWRRMVDERRNRK